MRRLPGGGRRKDFRTLDTRRRIHVRNLYLEVVDRAVYLAEPMRRPGKVDHDIAGANPSGQTTLDSHVAPDGRVRIRVGVRVAVNRWRDQGAARDQGAGALDDNHVLHGPRVSDRILGASHPTPNDANRLALRKIDG